MCVLVCDEVVVPRISPLPRQTADGHAACERCGRQLSKVKHHRPHGPGRACAPRCKGQQQTDESTAATAAAGLQPKQSRKRRAASDPGESPEPAALPALTRRVTPPKPSYTSKKQYNTRREEQVMQLLDETHARRMERDAAEAAATAATSGSLAHQ